MKQSYPQIFKRDPNYEGPRIVQTYLKKEKSSSSYKLFGERTTRFFTLNMQTFEFYYTPKDQYQTKDIKYIDIENIKYVVDRGSEKNSKGQCKEWTFQFIIYFTNKYTVIYCQNEIMKNLWLNAFNSIIKVQDKKRLFFSADYKEVDFKELEQQANSRNQSKVIREVPQNKEEQSAASYSQNSSNSLQQKQVDQTKAKNNIDSQDQADSQNNSRRNSNESYNSTDSQGRKRKCQFKPIKKRAALSSYKKQINTEQYLKNVVYPVLLKNLQQIRNRLKANQINVQQNQEMNLKESQNQVGEQNTQPKKQKKEREEQENINENNKYNGSSHENEIEVQDLESSNVFGSCENTLKSDIKVFRKSDDKNSHKKQNKNSNSKIEASAKKHKVNIFGNVDSSEDDNAPTIGIEFQQKQSQNGWDGNDVDILKNILRENSMQLKENNNEANLESQSKPEEQQQQESSMKQNKSKYDDIQEVNIIQNRNKEQSQESSKKMEIGNYDDWDVELDSTPTPATANKKPNFQYNNSNGYSNNNNNHSQIYSNQNQINHTHNLNQYFTSNNNNNKCNTNQEIYQQSHQKPQQKQQIAVVDNDYDNWDDDM